MKMMNAKEARELTINAVDRLINKMMEEAMTMIQFSAADGACATAIEGISNMDAETTVISLLEELGYSVRVIGDPSEHHLLDIGWFN